MEKPLERIYLFMTELLSRDETDAENEFSIFTYINRTELTTEPFFVNSCLLYIRDRVDHKKDIRSVMKKLANQIRFREPNLDLTYQSHSMFKKHLGVEDVNNTRHVQHYIRLDELQFSLREQMIMTVRLSEMLLRNTRDEAFRSTLDRRFNTVQTLATLMVQLAEEYPELVKHDFFPHYLYLDEGNKYLEQEHSRNYLSIVRYDNLRSNYFVPQTRTANEQTTQTDDVERVPVEEEEQQQQQITYLNIADPKTEYLIQALNRLTGMVEQIVRSTGMRVAEEERTIDTRVAEDRNQIKRYDENTLRLDDEPIPSYLEDLGDGESIKNYTKLFQYKCVLPMLMEPDLKHNVVSILYFLMFSPHTIATINLETNITNSCYKTPIFREFGLFYVCRYRQPGQITTGNELVDDAWRKMLVEQKPVLADMAQKPVAVCLNDLYNINQNIASRIGRRTTDVTYEEIAARLRDLKSPDLGLSVEDEPPKNKRTKIAPPSPPPSPPPGTAFRLEFLSIEVKEVLELAIRNFAIEGKTVVDMERVRNIISFSKNIDSGNINAFSHVSESGVPPPDLSQKTENRSAAVSSEKQNEPVRATVDWTKSSGLPPKPFFLIFSEGQLFPGANEITRKCDVSKPIVFVVGGTFSVMYQSQIRDLVECLVDGYRLLRIYTVCGERNDAMFMSIVASSDIQLPLWYFAKILGNTASSPDNFVNRLDLQQIQPQVLYYDFDEMSNKPFVPHEHGTDVLCIEYMDSPTLNRWSDGVRLFFKKRGVVDAFLETFVTRPLSVVTDYVDRDFSPAKTLPDDDYELMCYNVSGKENMCLFYTLSFLLYGVENYGHALSILVDSFEDRFGYEPGNQAEYGLLTQFTRRFGIAFVIRLDRTGTSTNTGEYLKPPLTDKVCHLLLYRQHYYPVVARNTRTKTFFRIFRSDSLRYSLPATPSDVVLVKGARPY